MLSYILMPWIEVNTFRTAERPAVLDFFYGRNLHRSKYR
jgi:hypothetical protein